MYCNKCGSKFKDPSQRFCENCGSDVFKDGYSNTPIPLKTAAPAVNAQVPNVAPGVNNRPVNTQAPNIAPGVNYGQQMNPQMPNTGAYNNATQNVNTQNINTQGVYTAPQQAAPISMKWHKWLVCFSLIFSAILNVGLGIATIMGFLYGDMAELVYSEMPDLKILDVVYGVLFFAIAVWDVYSWARLRKFRKNGPAVFVANLIFSYAVSVVYSAIAALILGDYAGAEFASELWSDAASSVTMGIVYTIANYAYYKKRKHLFVN